MNARPVTPRNHLPLFSRIVAAIVGGYLLASIATVLLSFILPASLPEAVLGATLLSFAIYTAAIIWVFAARSATRAWLGLLLPGAGLAVASFCLQLAKGTA